MPAPLDRRLAGAGLSALAAALVTLAGCARPESENKAAAPKQPEARAETKAPADPGSSTAARPVAAQPVSRAATMLKPFKEAVILDPPEGQLRPPDTTFAGKNVGRIFEAVSSRLWDEVTFTDAEGRKVEYTATLKTDLGEIELAFLPEHAPNHVRSFLALARAGYYDGLPFHACQRLETAEKQWGYLEAGCPKGTGETGYGSVGYWLRPEISEQLLHDVGSVGAWHDEDPDTAAGRFYITLHKAPAMDGQFTIFAKVTRGLEVARTINQRPAIDEFPFDRPREPVLIQQVVVQTRAAK